MPRLPPAAVRPGASPLDPAPAPSAPDAAPADAAGRSALSPTLETFEFDRIEPPAA